MEEIIFLPEVKFKIDSLSVLLFNKNYFSYIENAEEYVNKIYDFIYTLPHQKHRICKNLKHGYYYCRFKQNDNTTWFITFDKENEIYLIKNIFNNHTSDYPAFIRSIE